MMKYLFLVLIFTISSIAHGAAYLFETIPVGTSTPAVGTSTLSSAVFDNYNYVEGFYSFQGSGVTLLYRFDGGTVTANNSHKLSDGQAIKLKNIKDMRRVQFLASGGVGTVSATYSISQEDDN